MNQPGPGRLLAVDLGLRMGLALTCDAAEVLLLGLWAAQQAGMTGENPDQALG